MSQATAGEREGFLDQLNRDLNHQQDRLAACAAIAYRREVIHRGSSEVTWEFAMRASLAIDLSSLLNGFVWCGDIMAP